MKKIKLFVLFLIVLGTSEKLFAQYDLDVHNNNSSCSATIDFSTVYNCCNTSTSTGNSVANGTSVTLYSSISYCATILEVFTATVTIGGNKVTVGNTSPPCSFSAGSASQWVIDCGGNSINVTFLPATSTANALLTIN
ncbi:MAG: hypothetical protein WCO54_05965 [Bacteroidota bacterium]